MPAGPGRIRKEQCTCSQCKQDAGEDVPCVEKRHGKNGCDADIDSEV